MSNRYEEIADLIRQGRKLEAIKLLRETTGIGLKEAHDEIDRLTAALGSEEPPPPAHRSSTGLSNEVAALAQQGKKIEAIKLHRERTGLGLKEARDQVEALGGGRKSGCAQAVFVAAFGVMLLILFLILIASSGFLA